MEDKKVYKLADESLKTRCSEYLEYCDVELALRRKTLKEKRGSLLRFISYVGRRSLVIEICREYIAYLREKGLQISSVRAEFRHIRAFVTYLFEMSFLQSNWGRDIKLPKMRKKEMEIVPAKIASQIIYAGTEIEPDDNAQARYYKSEARYCLLFILKTGLRNFEARNLHPQDFNVEDETYVVEGKGGDRVRLPIPKDMLEVVRSRLDRKQRLFDVGPSRLQRSMKEGCRRLQINKKIGVHTLRHICATELLKAGVPIQNVRRLLRHSDIRITDQIYAHVDVGNLGKDLNRSALVNRGMTSKQMFNLIQELVEGSGIKNDNRYKFLLINEPGKSLQITIQIA